MLEDAACGTLQGNRIADQRGHVTQIAFDPAPQPLMECPDHHTNEAGAGIGQPHRNERDNSTCQTEGAQLSHWRALLAPGWPLLVSLVPSLVSLVPSLACATQAWRSSVRARDPEARIGGTFPIDRGIAG